MPKFIKKEIEKIPWFFQLKDLMLYRLNLKLNYEQVLSLFRQKQILRSYRHKNFQNQNNEDFLENITQFIE